MTRKSKGVLLVTVIEAIAFIGGVGIWFGMFSAGHPVSAAIFGTLFWTIFTEIEHGVADNVGHGRPPFRGVPFDLTEDGFNQVSAQRSQPR